MKNWTNSEVEFMRNNYPHISTSTIAKTLGRTNAMIHNKAFNLGLKKTEDFKLALAKKNLGCISTQFKTGHKPWNLGIKGSTGLHENCKKGQFKKGQATHNTKPLGYERINKDGYLERRVGDYGKRRSNYEMVHVIVWREHFGDIPEGSIVVFKNGIKTDFDIENLELITRAELMRRNTFHRLPTELKEVIRLHNKIKRRITQHEK
jgi:hypothetical protein